MRDTGNHVTLRIQMYSMPTFDTLSLSYTLGIKYTCTLGEDNMQKQWTGVTVTCVYINYVYYNAWL